MSNIISLSYIRSTGKSLANQLLSCSRVHKTSRSINCLAR